MGSQRFADVAMAEALMAFSKFLQQSPHGGPEVLESFLRMVQLLQASSFTHVEGLIKTAIADLKKENQTAILSAVKTSQIPANELLGKLETLEWTYHGMIADNQRDLRVLQEANTKLRDDHEQLTRMFLDLHGKVYGPPSAPDTPFSLPPALTDAHSPLRINPPVAGPNQLFVDESPDPNSVMSNLSDLPDHPPALPAPFPPRGQLAPRVLLDGRLGHPPIP